MLTKKGILKEEGESMELTHAELGKEYTISRIHTDDEELNDFLFTLGCYSGEKIVLVSKISKSYVIAIKDGRYNIDANLAQSIMIS